MFHVPEIRRVLDPARGFASSSRDYGNNGVFEWREGNKLIRCIASDGMGWEHVSVSIHELHNRKINSRMATWDEMCGIKTLFWDDEDVVVQYHPRKSEYVQNVSYVLHLWRPIEKVMPTPLSIMVGVVEHGEIV